MTKTNKEIRWDLAHKYFDELKKVNKTLDSLAELWYTEEEIKTTRERLLTNLQKKLSEEPWYEESKRTHLQEIKTKSWVRKAQTAKEELLKEYEEKLAKADAEISNSKKSYEEAQIAHRWKVEDEQKKSENLEIPQELKNFRGRWEKEINLPDDKKKAIIEAVNGISHRATIEKDGSRLVEFELWWKTYKSLDVNVSEHSDSKSLSLFWYNWQTNNEVKLFWMEWDDASKRTNRKLAEYVKEQENNRKMKIPTVEFQRDLINKLWDQAGLTEMKDKIAMWMYLTWNYGYYRLTMWNWEKSDNQARSRSSILCSDVSYCFPENCYESASLCLIACE